jgi:hypothetical protein
MADALDSKSSPLTGVSVQVRSPVLLIAKELTVSGGLSPNRTEIHRWEDFGKDMAFAWPFRRPTGQT